MIAQQPHLVVTFGLPGAGKTYVARCLSQFGFAFHDGDDDLPETMRERISASLPIDDPLRDEFFTRIEASTAHLVGEYPHIIVAQTFIKEKYRQHFLDRFPTAHFLLVEAWEEIRARRLAQRTHQSLAPDYVRQMDALFEKPLIAHQRILNNQQGDTHLRRQFARLFLIGGRNV